MPLDYAAFFTEALTVCRDGCSRPKDFWESQHAVLLQALRRDLITPASRQGLYRFFLHLWQLQHLLRGRAQPSLRPFFEQLILFSSHLGAHRVQKPHAALDAAYSTLSQLHLPDGVRTQALFSLLFEARCLLFSA